MRNADWVSKLDPAFEAQTRRRLRSVQHKHLQSCKRSSSWHREVPPWLWWKPSCSSKLQSPGAAANKKKFAGEEEESATDDFGPPYELSMRERQWAAEKNYLEEQGRLREHMYNRRRDQLNRLLCENPFDVLFGASMRRLNGTSLRPWLKSTLIWGEFGIMKEKKTNDHLPQRVDVKVEPPSAAKTLGKGVHSSAEYTLTARCPPESNSARRTTSQHEYDPVSGRMVHKPFVPPVPLVQTAKNDNNEDIPVKCSPDWLAACSLGGFAPDSVQPDQIRADIAQSQLAESFPKTPHPKSSSSPQASTAVEELFDDAKQPLHPILETKPEVKTERSPRDPPATRSRTILPPDDIDLLRPSDVRASMGITKATKTESTEQKQAVRNDLEASFASVHSALTTAEQKLAELRKEAGDRSSWTAVFDQIETDLTNQRVRLQKINLQGLATPSSEPKRSALTVPAEENKVMASKSPDSTSITVSPKMKNTTKIKQRSQGAGVAREIKLLDSEKITQPASISKSGLEKEPVGIHKVVQKFRALEAAATKAQVLAAAGRKLKDEVQALKSAYQGYEQKWSSKKPTHGQASVLHEHKAATLSEKTKGMGEGDIDPKVVDFNDPDKVFKKKAPHATTEEDQKHEQKLQAAAAEEQGKTQEKEKDRALYREVRRIYEEAYGTIDTKHSQGALLPESGRTDAGDKPAWRDFHPNHLKTYADNGVVPIDRGIDLANCARTLADGVSGGLPPSSNVQMTVSESSFGKNSQPINDDNTNSTSTSSSTLPSSSEKIQRLEPTIARYSKLDSSASEINGCVEPSIARYTKSKYSPVTGTLSTPHGKAPPLFVVKDTETHTSEAPADTKIAPLDYPTATKVTGSPSPTDPNAVTSNCLGEAIVPSSISSADATTPVSSFSVDGKVAVSVASGEDQASATKVPGGEALNPSVLEAGKASGSTASTNVNTSTSFTSSDSSTSTTPSSSDFSIAATPLLKNTEIPAASFLNENNISYKILAYDSATQTVLTTETTSRIAASIDKFIPMPEAITRLQDPAKFLPHLSELQASGYEIISSSAIALVCRKVREPAEQKSEVQQPPSSADPSGPRSQPAWLGTTDDSPLFAFQPLAPATGNFASPTGFVNYDTPFATTPALNHNPVSAADPESVDTRTNSAPRSGPSVKRQEVVFSGQKQKRWNKKNRRRVKRN